MQENTSSTKKHKNIQEYTKTYAQKHTKTLKSIATNTYNDMRTIHTKTHTKNVKKTYKNIQKHAKTYENTWKHLQKITKTYKDHKRKIQKKI